MQALIPRKGIERDYLFHLVRSLRLGEGFTGSTIPHIYFKDYGQIIVPLPDLAGQKRIVRRLNSIEEAAESARAQIVRLDSLVKSRFVEMFEGQRWPETPASKAMHDFRNGVSPSKDGNIEASVLTLSAVTRGVFRPVEKKRGSFKVSPAREKRVSEGLFMMCRGNGNRALVGRGAFSNHDYSDLVFPDTVIAAQVCDELIEPLYLANLWNRPCIREQIEAKARTTNGTYKVNQQMIKEVSNSLDNR